MAPTQWKCLTPGCDYRTEIMEASEAIEFLKLHTSQNHGILTKPEKPNKPVLEMPTNTIDVLDWDSFLHKFGVYKKLSGITGDAGCHFLDCLSKEVYSVLFSTYGTEVSAQDEDTLKSNLRRLVVRKQNKLLSVMELLALKQDSDERILNYISRIKAKARQCDLAMPCICGKSVDFKDNITLYMLVAGVNDPEIQEDLLTEEDLSLETAEKKAIAKESAKFSQSGLSGDKIQRLKSTYQKNKNTISDPTKKKCQYCGLGKHESREKECKAYSVTCDNCKKVGHFKKVCRSRKQEKVEKTPDSEECDGVFEISTLTSSDLVYDRIKKRWTQRHSSDKGSNKLPVVIQICSESYTDLQPKSDKSEIKNEAPAITQGIADTGCSTLCAGPDICRKLGIRVKDLLKSNITLKVADGRELTVKGAIPVIISTRSNPRVTSKQMLHVAEELKSVFLSKNCLKDLNVISPSFPFPMETSESHVAELLTSTDTAPCGCKARTITPDPPKIPMEPLPENLEKLRNYIVEHYSSSTMNMCSHQSLPEMAGPPLHFTLKEGTVPKVVHTPAKIPVHWKDTVKQQLDRDVRMGILKEVPPDEPVEWQHRMVVVRKHDGSPRRTVDMQELNKATLRPTHPLTSPYLKAMSVPPNTYKTVTDAWEGYHSIPLDEESSKLTRFITPYGAYRYKRDPQGWVGSGDAYNKRYDIITKNVKDSVRQVDDSLLWGYDIKEMFEKTCSYLSPCGRSGILQNPEKFQFCSKTVNWAGFVIGDDSVKPMPHLTKAIREFPTPHNKTDLRSFMALVQQVSYATAVAPLLLPFRKLLKDDIPWEWTSELQQTFMATRELLAERIEEGIKIFDPYKITMVLSDWCKHGVGYNLAQKHCACKITDDCPDIKCCKYR